MKGMVYGVSNAICRYIAFFFFEALKSIAKILIPFEPFQSKLTKNVPADFETGTFPKMIATSTLLSNHHTNHTEEGEKLKNSNEVKMKK